jgi:hypothetical protein
MQATVEVVVMGLGSQCPHCSCWCPQCSFGCNFFIVADVSGGVGVTSDGTLRCGIGKKTKLVELYKISGKGEERYQMCSPRMSPIRDNVAMTRIPAMPRGGKIKGIWLMRVSYGHTSKVESIQGLGCSHLMMTWEKRML